MRFFTLLCTISAVIPAIFAGPLPTGVPIDTYAGEKTGKHIVILKDSASKATVLGEVTKLLEGKAGKGVTHEYDSVFSGFAGDFDDATLAALQVMPGVSSISEDGIAYAFGTVVQSDAPWGLARLSSKEWPASQNSSLLTYQYKYEEKAGGGVDVYVIDTGINTKHNDFGDRARFGASFVLNQTDDGNGHGTHCAGTAVGGKYGVAKRANVIAVKVLSDEGSGSISDIIAGMGWVLGESLKSGRPSVASMSLGGGASAPLDEAAKGLVKSGVQLVVAAGNSNVDAKDTSPARVPEAITVGASDITDSRAFFSNFGPVVDVFAPGVNVTSAWIGSNTATRRISGTSMATPHVAGLVAYILSMKGKMPPAEMSQMVVNLALKEVLSDIPAGTPNLFANNKLGARF